MKQLCLVFLLAGAVALPTGCDSARAESTQPLTGNWCVRYTSGATAYFLIYNFNSDGNVTVVNSNQGIPAAGPGTDVYTRSAGLGQIASVGANQWQARYQYLDFKNGSLYRRFVATLPIVYDPASDTISNGTSTISLKFVDPLNADVTPATLPPQSYSGKRMDVNNVVLCDLSTAAP